MTPPAPAAAPAPQASPFATKYRTHTCGELRPAHKGLEVTICGAVDRFIDDRTFELRDGHGKTLVRLDDTGALALSVQAIPGEKTTPESHLMVQGRVALRTKPEAGLPTGEVELAGGMVRVLNYAKAPLLYDFRSDKLTREDKVRHRYLYLRNPKAHAVQAFRTRVTAAMRRFLVGQGFDEVETPVLANRWTPEAEEAFLAIRERAEIFALPGRRPVHPTLLMAGGFDRVFELGRRFRRKAAYGPYQQPEFTVLDMAMAFVDEADLNKTVDALLAHVFAAAGGTEIETPIPELTYDDAVTRYGSDAPDLRPGLEIMDVTGLSAQAQTPGARELMSAGGAVRALRVPATAAAKLKDKELAEVVKLATEAGKSGATVHWMGMPGATGAASAPGAAPLDEVLIREVPKTVGRQPGEIVFVVTARHRGVAGQVAGGLRKALGTLLGLTPAAGTSGKPSLVRITRLPYFQHDAASNQWVLRGDPLSAPVPDDLDGNPHLMRGQASYLVLNGVNVGGGSIRNHDPGVQARLFKAVGYGTEEVDARFGGLLETLKYGVPPHGRVGIGVDRLVALMLGLETLDDTIALPKTKEGTDPLARSPWPMDRHLVRGLFGL